MKLLYVALTLVSVVAITTMIIGLTRDKLNPLYNKVCQIATLILVILGILFTLCVYYKDKNPTYRIETDVYITEEIDYYDSGAFVTIGRIKDITYDDITAKTSSIGISIRNLSSEKINIVGIWAKMGPFSGKPGYYIDILKLNKLRYGNTQSDLDTRQVGEYIIDMFSARLIERTDEVVVLLSNQKEIYLDSDAVEMINKGISFIKQYRTEHDLEWNYDIDFSEAIMLPKFR